MNIKLFTLFMLSMFCLTACKREPIEKYLDKDRNEFAQAFLHKMINHDRSYLSSFEPAQLNDTSRANIDQLSFFLNSGGKLYHIKPIGASDNLSSDKNKEHFIITYECRFDNFYAICSILLIHNADSYYIRSYRQFLSGDSAEERTKFSFIGKGITNYIFFVLAILIPLFIFISIVFAFKTPLKRKWLWILLIVVANPSLYFNWYNDLLFWPGIQMQLFGIGVWQGDISAPWNFAISFPFGAIIFWFRRIAIIRYKKKQKDLAVVYTENTITNSD